VANLDGVIERLKSEKASLNEKLNNSENAKNRIEKENTLLRSRENTDPFQHFLKEKYSSYLYSIGPGGKSGGYYRKNFGSGGRIEVDFHYGTFGDGSKTALGCVLNITDLISGRATRPTRVKIGESTDLLLDNGIEVRTKVGGAQNKPNQKESECEISVQFRKLY